MKCTYLSDCVGWPVGKVGLLHEMIDDETEISRATFLRHVDRGELEAIEANLGYANHNKRGLTMAGDWHVSYHRSKLNGFVAYFFRQSAIEYVFVPQGFTWQKQSKSTKRPAACCGR